jgi:hypothetical protein
MNQLAAEILLEIAAHATPGDQKSLSTVCKMLNLVATKCLYREISLSALSFLRLVNAALLKTTLLHYMF